MKDNEENRQIFGSFIIAVINLFLAITSFFDGLVIFVIIPLFFLICSSIIFYRTVKTRRDNKKHKALQALYSQKIYHDSVAGSFSHIIYFNNAQKIANSADIRKVYQNGVRKCKIVKKCFFYFFRLYRLKFKNRAAT